MFLEKQKQTSGVNNENNIEKSGSDKRVEDSNNNEITEREEIVNKKLKSRNKSRT